jgi:hopene-associated glycosyltransferase HpnB
MTALLVASLACAHGCTFCSSRGRRAAERDDVIDSAYFMPVTWPRVVAVVPARNEAEVIAACVGSLLRQNYPGAFELVVVDDHSTDDTADIVRNAAAADRLVVLSASMLPDAWTGKLWAMNCGAGYVAASPEPPHYLWFIDADITCATDALTELVKRAERDGLVLASLMAKLHCESLAERALIPVFIFFFRMLYPFAWVNRPELPIAAAAGGCMLVRREALERVGGFAALRGELIDDCALDASEKQGPIWLGLHRSRTQPSRLDPSPIFVR